MLLQQVNSCWVYLSQMHYEMQLIFYPVCQYIYLRSLKTSFTHTKWTATSLLLLFSLNNFLCVYQPNVLLPKGREKKKKRDETTIEYIIKDISNPRKMCSVYSKKIVRIYLVNSMTFGLFYFEIIIKKKITLFVQKDEWVNTEISLKNAIFWKS